MISRTRRGRAASAKTTRPRARFAPEALESRTLLSGGGPAALAGAMFSTSYASLHLRPAAATDAPAPKAPKSATTTT